ncbi:MAG: hypothetical protein A2Z34_08085 [Planctomycetes bacterium RBG_16_59_8]|nr:MAG: hypothetical protein A2Z34_08085 [Planctomycetes bacterium RBG_16_59_8]
MTDAERTGQIVSAAMRSFAEHGFAGTTSKMLARSAGVSEALIFKHFPTKRALYHAIIQRKISEPSEGLFPEAAMRDEDDRQVLCSIASTLLNYIEADPTFMRILLFSTLEKESLSPMFFRVRVKSVQSFLRRYLSRRMKRRGMKRFNPGIAARAFLGMIIHHLMLKHVFGIPLGKTSRQELLSTWVALFLEGVSR